MDQLLDLDDPVDNFDNDVEYVAAPPVFRADADYLEDLSSETVREFIESLQAEYGSELPGGAELTVEQLTAGNMTSLNLIDGGGYAGDLLVIESLYQRDVRLLDLNALYLFTLFLVSVIALLGILIVIGLAWPVAISVLLIMMLFYYFASVIYRSVRINYLNAQRRELVQRLVRIRRLSRMGVARQPILLNWASRLAAANGQNAQ